MPFVTWTPNFGAGRLGYHHPGFSAYQGESVSPGDSTARKSLASYIVRAPFSLARLHYERDAGIVTYEPLALTGWNRS